MAVDHASIDDVLHILGERFFTRDGAEIFDRCYRYMLHESAGRDEYRAFDKNGRVALPSVVLRVYCLVRQQKPEEVALAAEVLPYG